MFASPMPGFSPRGIALRARPELPFPFAAPRTRGYHRARNALYHLFRALRVGGGVVLAPDYHHGNEIAAIRAAGARVCFYPIDANGQPDLYRVAALLREGARAILVIQYLGWPQPIDEIQRLARASGAVVIEDCALSLLSAPAGRPLGSTGDWSVFCLYKTLPVPNGALLVDNQGGGAEPHTGELAGGWPSFAARVADLVLDGGRTAADPILAPLAGLKRRAGALMTRAGVHRWPTGDSGFDLDAVDLRLSPLTGWLVPRFDHAQIGARRAANFQQLRDRLAGAVTLLFEDLPAGVTPLFFPILVDDKRQAAAALAARGVHAIEFWNQGDPVAARAGSDAEYLRRHVLELPLHQGLDRRHIEFIGQQVLELRLSRPGRARAISNQVASSAGGVEVSPC